MKQKLLLFFFNYVDKRNNFYWKYAVFQQIFVSFNNDLKKKKILNQQFSNRIIFYTYNYFQIILLVF